MVGLIFEKHQEDAWLRSNERDVTCKDANASAIKYTWNLETDNTELPET